MFFYLKDYRAHALRGLEPTQQIKPVNIFKEPKTVFVRQIGQRLTWGNVKLRRFREKLSFLKEMFKLLREMN